METYKIAYLRDLWQRFKNAEQFSIEERGKRVNLDLACILAERVGMLLDEIERLEMAGIMDVGLCGVKIIHPQEEQKIEWAFEPRLGYEIEPTLTQEEFEDVLTRIAAPIREE